MKLADLPWETERPILTPPPPVDGYRLVRCGIGWKKYVNDWPTFVRGIGFKTSVYKLISHEHVHGHYEFKNGHDDGTTVQEYLVVYGTVRVGISQSGTHWTDFALIYLPLSPTELLFAE